MAGLVPAIPVKKSTALHANEITGTRPVMTRRVSSPTVPGFHPNPLLHLPTQFVDPDGRLESFWLDRVDHPEGEAVGDALADGIADQDLGAVLLLSGSSRAARFTVAPRTV
jgi:hypothetical protein